VLVRYVKALMRARIINISIDDIFWGRAVGPIKRMADC
jgi:hypothetical protein